jgi:hypothetical protein
MNIDGFWPIFLWGSAGGLLAEFLGIWSLRKEDNWPKYFRRLRYYLISLMMSLIGGGMAVIYGMHEMPGLLALNIGASAPLMLQRLLTPLAPETAAEVPKGARVG